MGKRVTYIDSGILIAATRAEHKLFESAFAILDDPNREFLGSDFLKLEVLPHTYYFNKKEERALLESLFAESIRVIPTTGAKVAAAFTLACSLGLTAVDAIHLQTAVEAGVDEFITTEKTTSAYFRLNHSTLTLTSIHSSV